MADLNQRAEVEAPPAKASGSPRGAPILKLVLLGGILLSGFVAYRFTPLGDLLSREGIATVISVLRGSSWAPVLFVSIYAGATALAIPGSVLTLLGGAVFGFGFGTLYNSLGANIGANMAFLIARWLGKDGVRKIMGDRAGAFDRVTQDYGFQGLLTLRLIPVAPFNALNFGSGLTGMSWGTYALATVIGILPGTVVYTFFADALLQGSQEASRDAWIRVLIAGLLLVALTLLPTMLKRFKKVPTVAASLAFALFAGSACGAEASSEAVQTGEDVDRVVETSDGSAQLPDHAELTQVLGAVAREGRVDYASLLENRSGLDGYLDALGGTDAGALERSSADERLAFWINAYNACMLKRVIDNYPIRGASGLINRVRGAVAGYPENSVQQIDGVFQDAHCPVVGAQRSQDYIEHEVIRPMGDPRIHLAINCAAVSCPPLSPVAYEGATLDDQLDAAVRGFMADADHFRLEGGVLTLNKVLDWFGEDFGGEDGLRTFFAGYAAGTQSEALADPETRIEFFDYDWTLNDVND